MNRILKILNILGDIVLISYLFLINMEYWFSLTAAGTIALALKIINVCIQSDDRKNKFLCIAVTIIAFIILAILEIFINNDSLFAFELIVYPLIIYSVLMIISGLAVFFNANSTTKSYDSN